MNILIDVGHPAHVHYYRNLATDLLKKGHKIIWTVKDMPIIKVLMDCYGFNYYTLGSKADTLTGKLFKQIRYNRVLWKICRQNKIPITLGTSATITQLSRFTNIRSIVFDDDDDEVQPLVTRYVNPYASVLLSPGALKNKRKREDTIYYPGFHELAYLHPNRFKPNCSVLSSVGIDINTTFFIMRFNVFKAHHDVGIKGLSLEQKLFLIDEFLPYGKVFITTEREIEPELKEYQLKIPPEQMHSFLYYAKLYIGDSQTMTSEAAVLGVPSLRCNSFAGRISYLEELENKYGLTYAYKPEDFDKMIVKLKELLFMDNLKEEWQHRRQKMLSDKIDVTSFWTWVVDKYPESVELIRDEPDFWKQFK